jgi:hypothetical protein
VHCKVSGKVFNEIPSLRIKNLPAIVRQIFFMRFSEGYNHHKTNLNIFKNKSLTASIPEIHSSGKIVKIV